MSLQVMADSARSLSRGPLGIVSLFILMVYGFATLFTGLGLQRLSGPSERLPLIWFLVLFPACVLVAFTWLVAVHHQKLYPPSEYRDESNFVKGVNPSLLGLPDVGTSGDAPTRASLEYEAVTLRLNSDAASRAAERDGIYDDHRQVFLAHALSPSTAKNQRFDVFIYLVRHKRSDFHDVVSAEFFFGKHWGNRIFPGARSGNLIGVRAAAHGTFLCTCRVTFDDGHTTSLHRYIDFGMGEALEQMLEAR